MGRKKGEMQSIIIKYMHRKGLRLTQKSQSHENDRQGCWREIFHCFSTSSHPLDSLKFSVVGYELVSNFPFRLFLSLFVKPTTVSDI